MTIFFQRTIQVFTLCTCLAAGVSFAAEAPKMTESDKKNCTSLLGYMQECIDIQYKEANHIESLLEKIGDVFNVETLRDQAKLEESAKLLESYIANTDKQEEEAKKHLQQLSEMVEAKLPSQNTALVEEFKKSKEQIAETFTKLNETQKEIAIKLRDFLTFMSKGTTNYHIVNDTVVFDDNISASSLSTQFTQDETGSYLFKSYIYDIKQLVKTYSDQWQQFIDEYYGKKDLFQKIINSNKK